jgi:non-specific serine/threonine protein kinase
VLPLIGRTADVTDLLALLQTARLITIVGAPGIGKSRLALEVANQAVPCFADGVAVVPLADVTAAVDVPYAVLRTLGVTPTPHQSAETAITAYLAPRLLLLVIDNCEHILDCSPLFADWLAQAPGLKLLCTSRGPLDIYGEHEWPLAPLPVPDLTEPPDVERWGQLPAMQLLISRGRAIDPAFALTSENILPLATLCVALDGLPLALELAAVQLRELSPHLLAQKLMTLRGHGHLSSTWLRQDKRNIAERHRTLQAAIGWSYQRLTAAQQQAFNHLGVFVRGCSAEAAEAVAGAVAGAHTGLLAELARANLITLRDERIVLLETLRGFAVEQLIALDQLAVDQQRHAFYYTAFARQIFAGLRGDDQATWMQRALADHNNCLAALRWALLHQQGEIAISLAGSLWWFWYRRGLLVLGAEMLMAALQLTTSDLSERARALNGLASIHLAHDDYAASLACHEEGLALRRKLEDAVGTGVTLHNMGLTAYMMGDYARAIGWLHESIAADPAANPEQSWAHIGIIALDMLDVPQAKLWLERAYERVMQQEEGWIQAFVMYNLADALREARELPQAKELALTSLRLFEMLDDSYYLPDPLLLLAQIATDEGDTATAIALSNLALAQYAARNDVVLTASARLAQAELAHRMGRHSDAATQRQQAHALRQTSPRPLSPREQARYAAF